jgi:hypothetical protein
MPADGHSAVGRMDTALCQFVNGDTTEWKAFCSRGPDATLCGGWGG